MPEGKGLALPYTFFAGGDSPDFAAQQNFQHIVTFVNRRLARISEMITAFKDSDQTISSTSMVDDDHLVIPVLADSVYRIELGFFGNVAYLDSLIFQLTVPTGATLDGFYAGAGQGPNSEDVSAAVSAVAENTEVTVSVNARTRWFGNVQAVLVNSGTDGNLTLQWRKGSDVSTDHVIRTGSIMSTTSTTLPD